jgi:hypothetical protein
MRRSPFRLGCYFASSVALMSCADAPLEISPTEPIGTTFEAKSLPTERPCPWNDYYPAEAVRLGQTGRVSLAYSVAASGKAQKITLLEGAAPVLTRTVIAFLEACKYVVPSDWTSSGGPAKRYRLGAIFNLIGRPPLPPFEDQETTIVITATPIRGS